MEIWRNIFQHFEFSFLSSTEIKVFSLDDSLKNLSVENEMFYQSLRLSSFPDINPRNSKVHQLPLYHKGLCKGFLLLVPVP